MQIHVARGGEQLGVFSPDEVRSRLASGQFLPSDFGWADGQAEWVPLSSFPGLAAVPLPTTAAASPPPLSPRQTVAAGHPIASNEPVSSSGFAITSLVFGILSFTFLPFLASLPAVIFGHVARSKIKKSNGRLSGSGMALAGLIMGYIGVAFIPIFAALAIPVFSSVQLKAKQVMSLNQAKEIAVACKLYAVDHDGAFPKKLEDLMPDYLSDPKVLICPLSGPAEPIGYEYYGGKDTDPPTNILLVSKAVARGKQRTVVRVDSSGEVARDMPELPDHSQ